MKDEYFMALASHASMRSADLSRQVGAVIATKDGEVIALGCNEVPKFGGGMYWPGSVEFRDYQLGYDSGTTIKNDALYDVLNRFRREFENAAKDKKIVKSSEKIFNELLDLGNDGGIKLTKKMSGTLIRNLLEFGRSVHAEMAALMDAALRGVSVKGGTLYCTTFPCHLCARHIVAAGITRVVYIEPYPKSLAGDLYPDSLQVDPIHPAPELVNFEPFVGISPWKYASFFRSILLRKDDDTGKNISWTAKANTQRFHPKVFAYRLMECAILELLPKKVVKEDSLAACKKVEQCFKPNIEEIIVLKYPQKKPVR